MTEDINIPELSMNSEITAQYGQYELKYKILAQLPKGKNTRCYLALDVNKQINIVIKQYSSNIKQEQLENDAKYMEENHCAVIAQGYAHFMFNGFFTIAMKYYQNGTLQHYFEDITLGKHNAPNLDYRTKFCKRLAQAVACLHSKGLVHRAISPRNIFVSDDEQNLILSDFGSIIDEPDPQNPKKKKQKLSNKQNEILAPEIINEQPYTKAADMWSVGCVMYFILYEALPFTDVDENILISKIRAVNYNKQQPSPTNNIIEQLLVLLPEKRPVVDFVVRKLDTPISVFVYVKDSDYWMQQSYNVHTVDKIIDLKNQIAKDYPNQPVQSQKICFCTAEGVPNEKQELADDVFIFDYLAMKTRVLNVECVIILDKSGSMYDYTQNIKDQFKEFIKQMQSLQQNINISLVEFSDKEHTKTIFRHIPVQSISILQPLEYVAVGDTALLDTVGKEIVEMNNYIQQGNQVDLTTFFIITDGDDDDSEKFTEAQLKEMIGDAMQMGWIFDFTGPQGKEVIRQMFGIPVQNCTVAANGKEASIAFSQIKNKIREIMVSTSSLGVLSK